MQKNIKNQRKLTDFVQAKKNKRNQRRTQKTQAIKTRKERRKAQISKVNLMGIFWDRLIARISACLHFFVFLQHVDFLSIWCAFVEREFPDVFGDCGEE